MGQRSHSGNGQGRRRVLATFAIVSTLALAGPAGAAPPAGSGAGSVTGRVLDPSGQALPTGCVWIASGPSGGSGMTSSDGTFSLEGLNSGVYIVAASDCSMGSTVTTFAGSTVWQNQALALTVTDAGTASTGDITLVGAGTMSGTVVDTDGQPAGQVCVNLVANSGSGQNWWWLGSSDQDGRWSGRVPADMDGLVQFSDCSSPQRFMPTWLGGTDQASARTVRVAMQMANDIGSVTMIPGIAISGRITDTDGEPQQNVCVSAQVVDDSGGHWQGGASTAADGTYSFVVGPGAYSIWMSSCSNESDLIGQWYPELPANSSHPPTFTVAAPGATFDAALRRGGRAAGRLVDESGRPATGVCVSLHAVTGFRDGGGSTWDRVSEDGTWTSSVVTAGDYFVEYRTCEGPNWTDDGTWVNELRSNVYVNAPEPWSEADLTEVTILSGQTTTGVDDDVLHSAKVVGRVTTGGTHSAGAVCIGGIAGDDATRRTAADGTFSISVLPGRDINLTFTDCESGRGLAQQRRTVRATPGEAVGVTVDMAVAPTRSIVGSVRNAAGHAPTSTCVAMYVPDNVVGFANVQPDGSFQIDGLAEGDYWLGAFGCGSNDADADAIVDPDDGTMTPPIWFPATPIAIDNKSPDPAAQGIAPIKVRATAALPNFDFCLGPRCPTATIPTTTTQATTTPATIIPNTIPAPVPEMAHTPASQPTAVPDAPADISRRGGVAMFGRARWHAGPVRRSVPTVPGAAPALQRSSGAASPAFGTQVGTPTNPASESTVSGSAVSGSAANGASPASPTAAATASGTASPADRDAAVPDGVGTPVSRADAATDSADSTGFPWDLFGGVALVAGAAVAVLLIWRRRRPSF